ncbi:MAG: integrase [Candidatus Melainabacteria bacterium GWF2_37_15]|nr:MAG: integrase [Candidatus Melainabacteria bacterium GWF2_37_15]
MTENNSNTRIEAIEDTNFSYDGYEVVRGEYFAHLYEPSITFNGCKVYLNAACIKRFPDIDYVQILINSEEKKLAVRPCQEDAKDSFLWCTPKRKPKQITCRVFFAKIVHLLDWNPDYRYKLLGKLIKSGNEYLFIFDLTATEIYQKTIQEGEKPKASRTPVFPAHWQNQFGLPVEEHRKQLQVNIFNGYTVFGIKDKTRTNQEQQNPITQPEEI